MYLGAKVRRPGPGESDLLIPEVVIARGGTYLKSGEAVAVAVAVISLRRG